MEKRELSVNDGLKLILPKEVCSWADNDAIRRCIKSDNYITAAVTPSGHYVFFVYMYEIEIFNVLCGTKKEIPFPIELVTYIPTDDNTGYIFQIENSRLMVSKVHFNFALGLVDYETKHMLITNIDKTCEVESISYLESTLQLIIIYRDLTTTVHFRTFKLGTWKEEAHAIEQFGDGLYTRFPCLYNNYAYAFPNRKICSIRDAAKRFGEICEVNPRVVSTIPVVPIDRPQPIQRMQQMHDQLRQIPVHGFDPFAFARHRDQQEIPQPVVAPIPVRQRAPILPRFRKLPLINDLTCLGISEKIGKLENSMERFEFQWRGERLYLLWSIGIREDCVEDVQRNYLFNYHDFDTFTGGFVNFMAIFDIKNLTWYPIKIDGLSPYSDTPLLSYITADSFITLFKSQHSLPFKWSRQRGMGAPSSVKSILNVDEKDATISYVYRIPIDQPDTLLNLANAAFNRIYPNRTALEYNALRQRYGNCIINDNLSYNNENSLLEIYVYDIRMFGPKRIKVANSAASKLRMNK